MANIIRRPNKLVEVGTTETSTRTSVGNYIQLSNSKESSNNIEHSTGDFEQSSLDDNAKFLITNDDNPLVWGLKNLDRIAMIIAGKSQTGSLTFVDANKPVYSTANYIKSASLSDANDAVLENLQMLNPVKAGGKFASAFNALSLNITRDVQRGNKVYEKYIANVLLIGGQAIVGWSNG